MPIDSTDRGSDPPYVVPVWRGRTSGVGSMTSVAASTWELVFGKEQGVVRAASGSTLGTARHGRVPEGRDAGRSVG